MGLRIDTEVHVAFTYSVSKTTENLNATRNSVFSRPTNFNALGQITKEKAVTGSAGEFVLCHFK